MELTETVKHLVIENANLLDINAKLHDRVSKLEKNEQLHDDVDDADAYQRRYSIILSDPSLPKES